MKWILLAAVIGLVIALIRFWRDWRRPWRDIEAIIGHIGEGRKPRTFLVPGAEEPRRVGLALEQLFDRQRELDSRIAENAAGTRTIFSAMQDGLLVVDTQHRITLLNETCRALFRVAADYVGQPLLEVMRQPDIDRLIGQALSTGAAQQCELTVHDPNDSSARRMELGAVLMKNDAGVATGVVVLFHDVTRLREADEIRRDFVANVSHELRTPLSILRGYIETLLDSPATSRDELKRILGVMERHSKRLALLVDDLLTLAEMESSDARLTLSNVRIDDLFLTVSRDWEKRIAEKQLKIAVNLMPGVSMIRADETRLQEILYNLLDNAVKYSSPGDEIRLSAEQNGEFVILNVSDTGIGIGKEDLPRIFERFYRVDKARSRELGGTGLGLAIVKHIAQLHGGKVEAESELENGTTIRVYLPAAGR